MPPRVLASGPKPCGGKNRHVLVQAAQKETFLFNVQQTGKSLNRQNGFITTLEWLSCHRHFKITQTQTKVSFFYLNLYYKLN